MALSGGIKGHSLDTGLCSQGEADWNSVPPVWPPWLRSTARCCNLFHTRLLKREETREKKLGVAAKVQKEHAKSSSLSSPSDWLEKPFTWEWNGKNVYISLLLILSVLSSFGSTMKFIVDIYIDSVIFKMYSLDINELAIIIKRIIIIVFVPCLTTLKYYLLNIHKRTPACKGGFCRTVKFGSKKRTNDL